ncbi:MAG: hypothetical protein E7586_03460 [Ruminococcaceae bacterium]|nr:hypothetical protein [Oscillospiraceae bacterium]
MKLNLNAVVDTGFQRFFETVGNSRDPAIILDDSLKVFSKNKIAARIFPNLRKGRSVGGLMVASDKEKLRSLSAGQTVLVKLLSGETVYGATAVRFSNEILLIVRPLSAGLRERLETVYSKASGYDINILSEEPDKEEFMAFSLKNLCFPKETRYFNVAAVSESVINQLSLNHPSVREKITVNSSLKNNYACGSEYDFSIVLTYIVSFCMYCTKEKVVLELSDKNGSSVVKISAIPPEDMDESEELVNAYPKDNVSWHNLIKLLCDGNLWDLEIECGYKKPLLFTFELPAAEEKQPFVLSDSFKKTVAKILSAFFG